MVTIHSACFFFFSQGSFWWLNYKSGLWAFSFLSFSLILYTFSPFFLSISLRISRTLQSLYITQKGCVCANVNALSMWDSSAIYLCLYFFQLAFLNGKSCILCCCNCFPCVRHYLYFLFLPCTIFLKTLLSLFKTCNKKMQAVLFCW